MEFVYVHLVSSVHKYCFQILFCIHYYHVIVFETFYRSCVKTTVQYTRVCDLKQHGNGDCLFHLHM